MSDGVCLAWAHPGTVSSSFSESVLHLLMYEGGLPDEHRNVMQEGGGYIALASGPRIGAARNAIVRGFLDKHTAEWLLMLDADMTFEPNIAKQLLAVADAEKRPVVGALCFGGGRGFIFPTMYEIVDPAENDGNVSKILVDWPEGAVVQVDATGAACLLIHRSVLEEMRERHPEPAPWFHESVYKGHEFGEDWTFCLKVAQLGHPVYVATGVKTGHVKTYELTEDLWRSGRVSLEYGGGLPAERREEAKKLEIVNGLGQINRQQRRALARKGA